MPQSNRNFAYSRIAQCKPLIDWFCFCNFDKVLQSCKISSFSPKITTWVRHKLTISLYSIGWCDEGTHSQGIQHLFRGITCRTNHACDIVYLVFVGLQYICSTLHMATNWIYFANAVDQNELLSGDGSSDGLLNSLTHISAALDGTGNAFLLLNIMLADGLPIWRT